MKAKKALFSVLACAVVVGSIYVTSMETVASQTPEQSAKQVLNSYTKAIKEGNVEELMKITDDQRYKSDDEKRMVYTALLKEEPPKIDIVSVKGESDAKVLATIRMKTKTSGTHELVYPVVKEGSEWKLVIEKRTVQPTGE